MKQYSKLFVGIGCREVLPLLIVVWLCYAHNVETADAEAKNLAELNDICELIKTADSPAPKLTITPIDDTTITQIEQINITLAEPEWTSTFPTDKIKEKTDAPPCGATDKGEKCKEDWLKWQKLAHDTKTKESRHNQLLIPPDKLMSAQGRAAAAAAAALAEEAAEIAAAYAENYPIAASTLAEQFKKAIQKAAYNTETPAAAANTKCEATGDTDRKTACELSDVGKALCQAASCPCAKGSGGDAPTETHCGNGIAPTAADWNAATLKAAYATIVTAFAKAKTLAQAPQAILGGLQRFLAKTKTLGTGTGVGIYIGTQQNQLDCQAAANIACIDLRKATTVTTDNAATGIEWELKIHEAASKLQEAQRADEAAKAASRQLRAIKKQAEAIYTTLATAKLAESPMQVATKKPEMLSTQEKTVQAEEKCISAKDAEEYKAKTGCTYDKTKTKCTLSEEGKQKAAEKANQEAGGNDAKTNTTETILLSLTMSFYRLHFCYYN
uniref:Variant surface glycoprotein 1125.1731 n=1 Tax=Trypanosoma brucei TaxID=5691 RepID=A0A1J0R7X9_9TRYP|nr:variant surface glycoprotein 1125.1731 [Trypanosoma brucei]